MKEETKDKISYTVFAGLTDLDTFNLDVSCDKYEEVADKTTNRILELLEEDVPKNKTK